MIYVGLTDEPNVRKSAHGNPTDWQYYIVGKEPRLNKIAKEFSNA
mgnify:CR=1 FL=1